MSENNSLCNRMAAAAAQQQQIGPDGRAGGRRIGISARKLAATLWELQEIPLSRGAVPNDGAKGNPPANNPALSQHVPVSEAIPEEFPQDCSSNPSEVDGMCHVQEEIAEEDGSIAPPDSFPDTTAVADDVRPGPTTSGDLLKILNRVWALEEQSHSSTSTITTLRADLERARSHAEELTVERKSHRKDIKSLTAKLADQESVSEERQQEAVRAAIQYVKEELEDERKATRKLELLHKSVAKELIDVKKSLGQTLQNLERERKARDLMKDVCDELEREMGDDQDKVEELKRQSAKMREEIEDERETLQISDVWREEMVQMKLAEARLQLEEKNTTLDKLRGELQEFLQAKKTGDDQDKGIGVEENKNSDMCSKAIGQKKPDDTKSRALKRYTEVNIQQRCLADAPDARELQKALNGEEASEDDDDLYSIELNEESLSASTKATDKWSLASATEQEVESNVRHSINRAPPTIERRNMSQRARLPEFRRSQVELEASITSADSTEGGKWDYQSRFSQWIDRSIRELP